MSSLVLGIITFYITRTTSSFQILKFFVIGDYGSINDYIVVVL